MERKVIALAAASVAAPFAIFAPLVLLLQSPTVSLALIVGLVVVFGATTWGARRLQQRLSPSAE